MKLLLLLPIPFLIISVSWVYGYTAAYTLGFNAGKNNVTISACIKAMDYDRCYIGYITGHVQLEQSTVAYKAGFAMQRNGSMNANNDRCKVFISTQQYRFCGDGYNDARESERFDGVR